MESSAWPTFTQILIRIKWKGNSACRVLSGWDRNVIKQNKRTPEVAREWEGELLYSNFCQRGDPPGILGGYSHQLQPPHWGCLSKTTGSSPWRRRLLYRHHLEIPLHLPTLRSVGGQQLSLLLPSKLLVFWQTVSPSWGPLPCFLYASEEEDSVISHALRFLVSKPVGLGRREADVSARSSFFVRFFFFFFFFLCLCLWASELDTDGSESWWYLKEAEAS